MKEKIGRILKRVRKEKGMTLEEMAKFAGASRTSLSYWERGINSPPGDILMDLAKRLDFIDELLAEEPTEEELAEQRMEEMKRQAKEICEQLESVGLMNKADEEDVEILKLKLQQQAEKFTKLEKKISKFEKQLKDISDMKERMSAIEHQYNINQNRDIVLNTAGSKKT